MYEVIFGTTFNGIESVRIEDGLTLNEAQKRKSCYDNDNTINFCYIFEQ